MIETTSCMLDVDTIVFTGGRSDVKLELIGDTRQVREWVTSLHRAMHQRSSSATVLQ